MNTTLVLLLLTLALVVILFVQEYHHDRELDRLQRKLDQAGAELELLLLQEEQRRDLHDIDDGET